MSAAVRSEEDYHRAHLRELLRGQYHIEGFLGEGASSIVFRVTNRRLGRLEAIKVLKSKAPDDPSFDKRFIQEAKLCAALDHPHIVKVYDFGTEEGVYWYSMQLVEGQTLDRLIRSTGRLSERAIVQIAVPVLDALEYIHQKRIIHRDIKPSNIVLDAACRPYLMDFGIARSADNLKMTQTGILIGTPGYLSPEVVTGLEPDGQADIYSLGVTLYELLTGVLPFPSSSTAQSVFSRIHEDPAPLSDHRPEVSPQHAAIIMRALEREKGRRFSTAGDMRNEYLNLLRSGGDPPGPALEVTFGSIIWEQRESLPAKNSWRDAIYELIAYLRGFNRRYTAMRSLVWLVGLAGSLLIALAIIWPPWKPAALPTTRDTAPPAISTPTTLPAFPAAVVDAKSQPGRTNDPPQEARGKQPIPQAAVAKNTPESIPRRPVQAPQLLQESTVQLPEGQADSCRGRTIGISVIVGEDGRVKRASLLSSISAECDRVALSAVEKFIFKPATDARGQPVESSVALSVDLL